MLILKSYSPLRYPGGKGQIYGFVNKLFLENNLFGCIYIEPYAGGAGIAMRLIFENKVSKVILNDYDRGIYAVWHSILYETEAFVEKIKNCEISAEEWHVQKEVQKSKDKCSLLELGFSTFYLNRTNRSGIIKAGMIGGKNQDGNYKLDCRFNKKSLIALIYKIYTYRDRIEINNLDAIDFLEKVKSKRNQFYFIDPPYFKKGKELYTNFYTYEDHLKLSSYLKKNLKTKKILLSYDNCIEIKNMYKKFVQLVIELNYYVETKRRGQEVFILKNIITSEMNK